MAVTAPDVGNGNTMTARLRQQLPSPGQTHLAVENALTSDRAPQGNNGRNVYLYVETILNAEGDVHPLGQMYVVIH